MAEMHPIHPEQNQPTSLVVDLDDLTLGDLEDFEDITGVSFDEAQEANFRSIKAVKALVFLTMRKSNPNFTVEDARNVKLSTLRIGTDEDPTDAAGSNS